ncbi:TonB-dependent receptor [soil metagenome]
MACTLNARVRRLPRSARLHFFALSLWTAGCCIGTPALAQESLLRVDVFQAPLGQVLADLASQAGVDLVFAHRLLGDQTVSLQWNGDSFEEGSAEILRGTELRVEEVRARQFVLFREPPTARVTELEWEDVIGDMSGRVVDAETSLPLVGAHAVIVGLDIGDATDEDGWFDLFDLPTGEYDVRFSHVGYRTVRVRLPVYPASPATAPVVRLQPTSVESADAVVQAGDDPPGAIPGVDRVGARSAAAPAFLGESDLFQALEWAPGVGRSSSSPGELVVRGAAPGLNRYLLDGAPVIHPWHAFGLFSTFQPESLRRVRLLKGTLPAEFGGALSAVLDAESRDGLRSERWQGTASVSPIAARFQLEGSPLDNTGVTVSLRRSHLGLRFPSGSGTFLRSWRPSADTDHVERVNYGFTDGHLRLTWAPTVQHRLSASGYVSGDAVHIQRSLDNVDIADETSDWQNSVISLRHQYTDGRRLLLTSTAYYSAYTATATHRQQAIMRSETGFRADAEWFYSARRQQRFGVEVVSHQTGGLEDDAALATAIYYQEIWTPQSQWVIQPGLRTKYYSGTNVLLVDPRLHVRYATEDGRLFFRGGLSRQSQAVHRLTDSFASPFDMGADSWRLASSSTPPARAWQSGAGSEWAISDRVVVAIDVFARSVIGLLVPAPLNGRGEYVSASERASGLEASIRWHGRPMTLGVAYSALRSRIRSTATALDPSRFDVPHSLKLLAQHRSADWLIAAGFTLQSGRPDLDSGARLTTYSRLDIAAGRRFDWMGLRWDAQLQAYNVFNARNVVDQRYNGSPSGAFSIAEVRGLPRLPLASLRVAW